MPRLLCGAAVLMSALVTNALASAPGKGVEVTPKESARRVDVTIDGQPFTSYIWPTSLKKPVLYPLIASDGTTVTRGYPLEPKAGERTDHPHHAGMWFNYGNVNGFDFWNNSDAIKPENRAKMGTIEQKRIVSAKSGADQGELTVESTWITGTGQPILNQTTRYVFAKHGSTRSIDEITTLTALDKVVFNDDKEGLLGIRVASFLESANEKGGTFTDASGKPTQVAASSRGANGVYLTSEGKKGEEVWSTRGKWCILTGSTDGKTETIAILDHPKNPGYPTYWHARGYGLFAANPLGQKIFDPKQSAMNYTIEKGKTAEFRYRVLLMPQATTPEEMNHQEETFAAEYR